MRRAALLIGIDNVVHAATRDAKRAGFLESSSVLNLCMLISHAVM